MSDSEKGGKSEKSNQSQKRDRRPANNAVSAAFSELVTQWERNFDALANQFMGTETYSQAMNDMQKAQLGMQRNFADFMSRQLETMSMPTREDVVQLTELVRQLDRRMERIEEKLALNDRPARKTKRPARTRTPQSVSAAVSIDDPGAKEQNPVAQKAEGPTRGTDK
ncbi:MAG: hypothetical protein AAF993_06710 [Pseudomonadota bacterium]